MDLSRSDLPEEVPKLIVPANYVGEMYDNENDTTHVYTGYTRYEIFYRSEK